MHPPRAATRTPRQGADGYESIAVWVGRMRSGATWICMMRRIYRVLTCLMSRGARCNPRPPHSNDPLCVAKPGVPQPAPPGAEPSRRELGVVDAHAAAPETDQTLAAGATYTVRRRGGARRRLALWPVPPAEQITVPCHPLRLSAQRGRRLLVGARYHAIGPSTGARNAVGDRRVASNRPRQGTRRRPRDCCH